MKTKTTLLAMLFGLAMSTPTAAQTTPRVVDFDQIEQLLNKQNDTTYVLNFWATWCKPCIAELPHFVEAQQQTIHQKVAFYFISLDFDTDLETKLVPFLKKKPLPANVWLLNNTNYNSWINKISPTWKGAIPATLIYNNQNQKKYFESKSLTQTQLLRLISNANKTK